jgi:uncharacterized ParB-like nuclease family protein
METFFLHFLPLIPHTVSHKIERETMKINNESCAPTEEHLTKVLDALTDVVGEEAIGRVIVACIRDCHRLDALERIRTATTVEIVLSEMQPYLDNSTVCFVGIQAVLAIMETSASEKSVIRIGFQALCGLVHDCESNADVLVLKLGGAPFLMQRMIAFQADAQMMAVSCEMLLSLSHFSPLREPLIDAAALSALGSAFESHKEKTSLRTAARQAVLMLLEEKEPE